MSNGISRTQILSIYKLLLRESQKFANYNFRSYALRRTRDAFKESKTLNDDNLIKKNLDYAKENLAVIKRQVIIGDMYKAEKLVIENLR